MLRKLLVPIVLCFFLLTGCICKTDENILRGMQKLEIAVIKMSIENNKLWTKEAKRVKAIIKRTKDPVKKAKYEDALKHAEDMLKANSRLPEVLKELRLALEGKGLEDGE